ncbi:MAG: hypothetical protein IKC53_01160 [Lentisphaeria bacterium]|nr:hypothetical protein [Lentisphaeria bacterium]
MFEIASNASCSRSVTAISARSPPRFPTKGDPNPRPLKMLPIASMNPKMQIIMEAKIRHDQRRRAITS